MALFLAVLGGAAVVELHRAITHGHHKDRDLRALKEREELLRRQLQEVQKELETTKSQRELTQKEASHLAAVNEQLRLDAERLEKQAETLETEKKDLSIRADRLLERQQLLEQCAESLRLENGILLQQFEKLKMKHDEEIAALEANIANIQKTASRMLQNFTEGKMNAQELIEGLAEVGVELQLPENELVAVQEKLNAANTTQERAEVLESAELKIDGSWLEQIKLVSSSPTLAARLVGMAAAQNKHISSGNHQLSITPRSLEETSIKLASHAVLPEGSGGADTIPTPQYQEREDKIPAKIHQSETLDELKTKTMDEKSTKQAKTSFRNFSLMNRKKQKSVESPGLDKELMALHLGAESEDVQPVGNAMVSL